jgi:exo-1,4-beta-D-glucosaminidase
LVNDTLTDLRDFSADVTLVDIASKVVLKKRLSASADANVAVRVTELPALDPKSGVYFLDLKLKNPQGQTVSENFYWLSPKTDVLDPGKSTEAAMPNKSFADFTALNSMPVARVDKVSHCQSGRCEATLTNASDQVAFFVELQLNKGQSPEPVLPVFWSDNDVSLLPHESKTLVVTFSDADLAGAEPSLSLVGWNLEPVPSP